MSKSIIIIGGGVAGLSAGIYGQMAGFDTTIYEKNGIPGGNCSGWSRNGYYIDNCLHWLTGTLDDTMQNQIWRDLGVLGDGIAIIKRDSFFCSEWGGQRIYLWRDLERTRQDMLALSPEDEHEINCFIDYVRLADTVLTSRSEPKELLHTISEMNFSLTHGEMAKAFIEYIGLNLEELANRFQHPLLQKIFLDFMAKDYEAYWLVLAYSFFVTGNGDLPEGGSMGMVRHMRDTYLRLGGRLELNTPVEQILINKKKFEIEPILSPFRDLTLKELAERVKDGTISRKTAKQLQKETNRKKPKKFFARNADGVLLYNGSVRKADYIICACDINYTFRQLLKKKYTPASIRKVYKDKKQYPLYSSFQVAFSVDGLLPEIDDTVSFDCSPLDVGLCRVDRICVKNYRGYGDYIAPARKTVIQCSIVQYERDYKYWNRLYQKRDQYLRAKQNTAEAIKMRIETRFPEYEGRLHLLDVWTPASYAKRINNYKGAYMRFITKATSTNAFLSSDVRGLRNVYLANHWLRYPGGVPTAAYMGKIAVKAIEKIEGMS